MSSSGGPAFMSSRSPVSAAKRLALVAALGGSMASAQLVEPRTATERAWVESVSKSVSSCFTALGPKRAFPNVAAAPPQGELLAAVLMPVGGPRVSDGYNYMLMLHGRSNSAFVVQLGGFAAERKVYGPLPLNTQCTEASVQGASSAKGGHPHSQRPAPGAR